MHDPDGFIKIVKDKVIRTIQQNADGKIFLKTDLVRQLIKKELIIDFDFVSDNSLVSPRVPFVSYPSEWCDEQLYVAATLTLSLANYAVEAGFELKDANAANVIFDGTIPKFCDHLSFIPITTREWWAMGQFARHFIFPLVLAQKVNWNAFNFHRISTDGINPKQTKKLLGYRKFLSLSWPLMMGSDYEIISQLPKAINTKNSKTYHKSLIKYCEWCLPRLNKVTGSHWVDYVENRKHYTEDEVGCKKTIISEWMVRLSPTWVVDLGCNTGEFTFLAAENGASVIAVDSDHDSINELYRLAVRKSLRNVFPVIADIADLSVNSGFLGEERLSLLDRLKECGEMVICLGLLHHLIAGRSVPFDICIKFLNQILGSYLIIELISNEDPMVVNLMSSRRRTDPYPNLNQQYEVIAKNFQMLDRRKINKNRELVLFKKPINTLIF